MGNRTYAMIKPDAIRNGHMGRILDRVLSSGFKILGAKLRIFIFILQFSINVSDLAFH